MINLWKIITEPKVLVEKICNECSKVIETFDATHPLTQYMIFDLNLTDKSDLSVLDMGLAPYHWCPLTPNNHCLVPMATSLREIQKLIPPPPPPPVEKAQEELKERTIPGFAPYRPPQSRKSRIKGRPPSTALNVIKDLEKKEDDSTNSV